MSAADPALRQRVVAAAVLLPAFLAALWWAPQWLWAGLMGLVALLALYEWARLSRFARGLWLTYLSVSAALLALLYSRLAEAETVAWRLVVVSLVFWLLVAPAWLAGRWRVDSWLLRGLTGWVVVLPTWVAMVELRLIAPGAVLYAMGVLWVADSAAYFAGRRFGRHKLAASISPGKTWEGVAGAFLAALSFAAVVAATGPNLLTAQHELAVGPLVAATSALVAFGILGDLFESHLKRVAGVKDSGTLIPGHGGVLDRIDSQTAALPLALLFAMAVRGGPS